MAKKKKYSYDRKGVSIRSEIYNPLKEYCKTNHPGLKMYVFVEGLFTDFLKTKGVFLP